MVSFDSLWKHQQQGVVAARSQPHLAIFYEVGTGKTATMIYILREEYQRHLALQNTLIFAPLSICAQWKKEFERFSQINADSIHVLTGTGKDRAAKMQEIIRLKRPCIVVTNYEGVQSKPFYAELLKWSPDILVCDESHRLKDSTSVRAKLIFPLARAARRRFIMTGTPILNSMLDIFGQFNILDTSIFGSNFFEFKRKYFYDVNAAMPRHLHFPNWQPLPHAAQSIGEKISYHSVQAKKSECLDLPPLLKIPVYVGLSSEQSRVYESMKKDYVAELGGGVVAAEFAMTKTIRLQQILAGFIMPEGADKATWCKDNPRLDALDELLEKINGEKVIIWTVFKPTYDEIAKVCEKRGLSYTFITGEQNIARKQTAVENFCGGKTQVLIANPAAGGTGLNLVEAKFSIYYTRGYSLEQYLQSESRNFRGGSERHAKVVHFHIQAEGTLDEVIAKALLNKENIGQSILNWAKEIR